MTHARGGEIPLVTAAGWGRPKGRWGLSAPLTSFPAPGWVESNGESRAAAVRCEGGMAARESFLTGSRVVTIMRSVCLCTSVGCNKS